MAVPVVLPAGFRSRAATDADVEAIHALVAATERELHGEAETAVDGIKAVLSRPGFDPTVDSVVVHDPDGRLAAWAWLNRGKRAQIDVDPGHRGLGIGTALLDWAGSRAVEAGTTDWIAQAVDDKDQAGVELVRARGYDVLAVNWQLELPMDSEPVIPALPEGITIRPFAAGDAAATHLLIEDAFDEWQPRRKSYEEWAAMTIERSSFAPELSPLVFAGDELVGVALCLDLPDTDEGYIEQLAVRRDHRGKGLARALLAAARHGFYRQGKRNLTLWTHSDTGALAMYERLGMTVRRSTTIYRGHLAKP
jgi:mycothiol synthase